MLSIVGESRRKFWRLRNIILSIWILRLMLAEEIDFTKNNLIFEIFMNVNV